MSTNCTSAHSLVFFHIPKTGGTTATAVLQQIFRESVSNNGNLSAAILSSRPDMQDLLFHGHAEHEAYNAVPVGAITAVILRTPMDQAISNYLHILNDQRHPLHDVAIQSGFSEMMCNHWPLVVFQTVSLDVPISATPVQSIEDLFQRLPAVHQFLNEIEFVGCLENIERFLEKIAERFGRKLPVPIPCLNRAISNGPKTPEIEQLRSEYKALVRDPLMQRLMAVENETVSLAVRRSEHLRSKSRSEIIVSVGRAFGASGELTPI